MKYDDNVEARYGIKLVSDRVVRKEAQFSTRESFEWIRNLVLHMLANPNPMVVPVYRFEVMEETNEADNSRWGVYKYAYEMMRLPMLTNEEKSLITTLILGRKPVDRDDPRPKIQDGWKEYPTLVEFMNRVLADGYYTDLHDNNFLKDEEGNYRIIDLEGFGSYPGLGHRR
jgi:hypothetical protein